jgi:DNA helicase-2/ATP-dependent DNA helicase PcrA
MFRNLVFLDESQFSGETRERFAAKLNRKPLSLKAALESWTPQADSAQLGAIRSRADVVQVVAAAGTGKTQSLVNIALERMKHGAHPEEIVFVTFSRAAAASLRHAIASSLEKLRLSNSDRNALRTLNVQTLNALGRQILEQHFPEEVGELADDAYCNWQSKRVVEDLKRYRPDAASYLPPDLDHILLREYFSILKANCFDPKHADPREVAEFFSSDNGFRFSEPLVSHLDQTTALTHLAPTVASLYEEHDRRLRRDHKMDFGDQKLRPFIALHQHPEILHRIEARFSSIIVDEFQDVNPLDFEFVLTIGGKARLVVAGDDDQAIYGFRGCTPAYMVDLSKHLETRVDRHELRINYRCPSNVLEIANNLIQHNIERIPKNPTSSVPDTASIRIVRSSTVGQEAQRVSEIVKHVCRPGSGVRLSDIGILFRTHGQSLPLQIQFALDGIPFLLQREGDDSGLEFLTKISALIRFSIEGPDSWKDDWQGFAQVLKAYFRFFGPNEVRRLEKLRDEGLSVAEAIKTGKFYTALPKAKESKLSEALQELSFARSPMSIVRVIAKRFRGLSYGGSRMATAVLGDTSWDALSELVRDTDNAVDLLSQIDRAIASMSAQDITGEGDKVRLLTYFGGKGLQWHTVILLGCNEDLMPHPRGVLEEERRLFYVGLTRCSANLIISHVAQLGGREATPSRFILETGVMEMMQQPDGSGGMEENGLKTWATSSLPTTA